MNASFTPPDPAWTVPATAAPMIALLRPVRRPPRRAWMRAVSIGLTLMLMLVLALSAGPARAACGSLGCVSAGPRLASVNSTQGVLLNALLGGLTNSTLTLTVLDWNTLATGDLSLLRTVSALQASVNASTPASTLTANATVAQILTAASTGATAEGRTQLAASLNALAIALNGLSTPIQLGQLLQSNGVLGTTRINALELVTGVIQLYNGSNVATTPNPITLSGSSLGLGSLIGNVALQAQVVEPPVINCGAVGTSFHSAAIRVKLSIDLVSVALNVSVLDVLLGGTVSASIAHLDVYVEVARTDGVLTAINALSSAVTVQATPGVAALYLGTISDSLFFNRNHAINVASDLTWGTIGQLSVGALTVDILAQAAAVGSAVGASTVTLTPGSPTATVYSNAGFATTLVSTLIGNLQVNLGPGLAGGLVTSVINLLKPILQTALTTTVNSLVTGLIDPLLNLLGIRLGETDISTEGVVMACAVSGNVYSDVNHNGALDGGEAGTGLTLYAKLIPATQPAGPAVAVAAISPSAGTFSFTSVAAAGYSVVINATASATDLVPATPAGWLGTEAPTLTRSFTLSTADVPNQRFGLFNGSKLSGTIFKDNGLGGGIANNGIRDGTEPPLSGGVITATDAGATLLDRAVSADLGTYTLWIPASASGAVQVAHAGLDASWLVVSGAPGTTGGSFSQANGTVSFTPTAGTVYTGLNFGDVPVNVLQPDGQQSVLAGSAVVYAHSFTSGTGGTVTLSASAPATPGWTQLVYLDANCNGLIDPGEVVVSGAITMVADQKLCLLVKVTSPAGATDGAQLPLTLSAHYVYANSALTRDLQRSDLTTVGEPAATGLKLVKTVDKTSAVSGDVITYTITYTNQSTAALATLKIQDATPAYTVLQTVACGPVPNAQISCAVSTQPAVGASGRIEWTFTGTLGSGLSGNVTFAVKLQ
ncbi:hypothetical protein CDN99_07160 [Roseateles aquatilis]|uniref:DUF11 domain-containing protein n=1 Tax=Roseateles aquatilis TaxID=431061 RepID=A0A246JHL6_9BURK|nr:DUF11 domain-containing protein [Roseateles aquatilis]OWQ92124.1 hypothetical protein CDN99_07160 [Roseateles aquatilis]